MLSKVGGTSTVRALMEGVVAAFVLYGILVQPMLGQQRAESAPAKVAPRASARAHVETTRKKSGSPRTSSAKSSTTKAAPSTTQKNSITEADRLFFEKLAKRPGTDQEVLLLAVIADELEGNYSVVQKLRDLQNMYANNNRGRLPVRAEVWICGKLAYYEFVHGDKSKAPALCNLVLNDIKTMPMPEPIDLDGSYFFIQGVTAMDKVLYGLNRREDFNRTQTWLGHAIIRLGREKSQDKIFGAVLYYLIRDYDSARALCSDVIKEEPGYAASYYLKAVMNFKDSKIASALKDLEKTILICPDFTHAYMLKGLCLLESDKKDEGMAELNKAVEMSHISAAYAIRAEVKLDQDDVEGAQSDIEAAIKASDADFFAYSIRADVNMHIKDFSAAVKDYTHAIELLDARRGRFKARLYYRRGLCYRALRDRDHAIYDFKQAMLLDSERISQVKKLLAKIEDDKPEKEKNGEKIASADKSAADKSSADKSSAGNTAADKSSADKSDSAKKEKAESTASSDKSDSSKDDDADLNSEEGKGYVAAFDVASPTYREGQKERADLKLLSDSKKSSGSGKHDKKKSWIDDAPVATKPDAKTGDAPDAKNNSGAARKVDVNEKQKGAEIKSGETKSAETKSTQNQVSQTNNKVNPEDETSDPYLRYLEARLNAAIVSPPSANVSAKFQISNDGVPIVLDIKAAGINYNRITNLIISAAPFKAPPADKKMFKLELQAGSSIVKVTFE